MRDRTLLTLDRMGLIPLHLRTEYGERFIQEAKRLSLFELMCRFLFLLSLMVIVIDRIRPGWILANINLLLMNYILAVTTGGVSVLIWAVDCFNKQGYGYDLDELCRFLDVDWSQFASMSLEDRVSIARAKLERANHAFESLKAYRGINSPLTKTAREHLESNVRLCSKFKLVTDAYPANGELSDGGDSPQADGAGNPKPATA
jgi:hypothetical protein